MGEIKVELTSEECRIVRDHFRPVWTFNGTPEDTGDRYDLAQLIVAAGQRERPTEFIFSYPQIVGTLSRVAARGFRDALAGVLRDPKQPRLHPRLTAYLSKLDDWLDTPIVDRIGGLG